MTSEDVLFLEKMLASCHRRLLAAHEGAARVAMYGLEDDLWQIAAEVARLMEDLLKNDKRLRTSRI